MKETVDVYGEAIQDYFNNKTKDPLILFTDNDFEDPDEMPVDLFFRNPDEFPEMEQIALALCDGKVLDVGAGAGSHSLYLQDLGFDVTALELSEAASEVMKLRGVKKVVNENIFHYQGEKFDTLLFLMNGIGLVQTMDGLRSLFDHAKTLLNPGGQLLFDTSDINNYYDLMGKKRPMDHYMGEIDFQYEYKNQKGQPFRWLYIEQAELIKIGNQAGWVVQILDEDENNQYLVRMELRL